MAEAKSQKGVSSKFTKKLAALLQKGKRSPFPRDLQPMLATLVDKPFDEPGWLYEVKWDGYRSLIYLNKGNIEMRSRNNKPFNEKFYAIYDGLQGWNINAVLDGEIIVIDETGVSNFSKLQEWRSEADGELVLYLFDILWIDGYLLTELPLADRKEILQVIIPDIPFVRLSESFQAGAKDFFEAAKKLHLEGIIAKKASSKYFPGLRSREWLKIKTANRQEVIIGGFTNNEGSNKLFSALLVGVNENGQLLYTGKIGTGFSQKLQQQMMEQFQPLIIKKCPFAVEPDVNKPSRFRPDPPKATATWLKPKLICEVSYAEMTSDGVMRHPSFEGMRDDKSSGEVVREKKTSSSRIIHDDTEEQDNKGNSTSHGEKKPPKKLLDKNRELTNRLLKGAKKSERKTLLNPKEKSQTRTINGHDITFNNLDKIYYPKRSVTKRDVINYYYQVTPYMLPYMKDRPQTLIRYPNGINGESFYQKDVTGKVPEWIKLFPYSSEKGGNRNFMVVTNEASLLLIASMGGIEMHPWSSRIQKPDHPDWCIIDLDPTDKNTFDQVITAAQVTKKVLDAIEVPAFCKTSGSTGMHIYIPLEAKYSYEQSKEFGRVLVKIIHEEIPAFTSIERLTELRKGKLYLDFLQNRPQATLAAPYSLRPAPDATVSMPLHWAELKKGLKREDFNIFNALVRVKKVGDLFEGVLGKGINMKMALKKIQQVFGKQQWHPSLDSV